MSNPSVARAPKAPTTVSSIVAGATAVGYADMADASSVVITEYGPTEVVASVQNGKAGFDFDGIKNVEVQDFTLSVSESQNGQKFKPNEFGSIFGKEGFRILANGKDAVALELGDVVGAASDQAEGLSWTSFAGLYRDSSGPLGTVGDSIFVGLQKALFPFDSDIDAAREGGQTPSVFYGWAEIERGSLTLLNTGFGEENEDVTIAFGEIAPVPVPASFALLAAGVGGLAALRRRKRPAAEA